MSDWYPIVWKLDKIDSLPNSDFLEITTVMNEYPCIIRKGLYKEGQLVSWIPYDSVCPDIETFAFLAPPPKKDHDGNIIEPSPTVGNIPQKYRTVKSKKIRGVYSEGLIVEAPLGLKEGDSIVEYFNLTKRVYEEELPDKGSNDNENDPKTFILHKYDLDGMAKYGYVFEDGEDVIISEKIEGENCAIVYAEDKLWVKSRNHFNLKRLILIGGKSPIKWTWKVN
jgi:RNA ligase (TIGR02306 family)